VYPWQSRRSRQHPICLLVAPDRLGRRLVSFMVKMTRGTLPGLTISWSELLKSSASSRAVCGRNRPGIGVIVKV
jgi:hypothetical protein